MLGLTLHHKYQVVVPHPFLDPEYDPNVDLYTEHPLISIPLLVGDQVFLVVQVPYHKGQKGPKGRQKILMPLSEPEEQALHFLCQLVHEQFLRLD